ncbi:MAG: hypothetical protein EOP51_11630 [Sphingobacteriales bacterium]|nr:MAG: hypothetical protein EOP51_11630 [Sphingobacteriales bacterium]
MGLFACILFSIIACWITISLNPKLKPIKGSFVFITGAVGGTIGAMLGRHFHFADLDMFNMYSVGMGIVSGISLTTILSFMKRTDPNDVTAEMVYEEENY